MSLVVLKDASLSFAGQRILVGASLHIAAGERLGLVGVNGSGKSTLLRILLGKQSLDDGTVQRTKGCRLGYLPQDVLEIGGETVLGSVLETVPGRGEIEEQLTETQHELQQAQDTDSQMHLAQRLGDLQEQLDRFQTYYSEHRAQEILLGLGFSAGDFSRPPAELSGGWKTRAALAGLLFRNPDLLLLDEPTNHLDVPTVAWLDGFLRSQHMAIVLICHDREFLNRHIERVVSFEPEGLRAYRGNYDAYRVQRADEEERLEAEANNRERRVRELQRFVDRFRAKATKARQAQSRAKQIEKLQAEIDAPIIRPRSLSFSFPPTTRTGKDVLVVDQLSKSYGDNSIYRRANATVYAQDRIAIIGKNGVGKTTLLKMLAGELASDGGEIRLGSNVKIGYYAQHQAELLHPKNTVLKEVWQVASERPESTVRGICGAFLFSGDAVDKPVSVLSGGERARVLLARLLVNPGNLLLMDEPTNHLDIHAAEALADALRRYDGTLVFVSHNSGFVNRLATKVWDVVDQQIVPFVGNLDDYFRQSEPQEAASTTARKPPRQSESATQKRQRKRREAEQRNNVVNRQTRTIKKMIEKLEARIAQLEAEQTQLESELASPELYQNAGKFRDALGRFESNRAKLAELLARWEHQQEQLEADT